MADKPTIKDIERLIADVRDERDVPPDDGRDITLTETTIGTEWEPEDGDGDGDELDPGETTTETAHFTQDSNGNWVVDRE